MTTKKTTDTEAEAAQGIPAAVLKAQAAGNKDVSVTLAHFWTDPDTGKKYVPGDKVTLPADAAASLAGSGYVVREDAKGK